MKALMEDGAAARRLGKPVILLSYPDEAHHLRRRENQKDFQIRTPPDHCASGGEEDHQMITE